MHLKGMSSVNENQADLHFGRLLPCSRPDTHTPGHYAVLTFVPRSFTSLKQIKLKGNLLKLKPKYIKGKATLTHKELVKPDAKGQYVTLLQPESSSAQV